MSYIHELVWAYLKAIRNPADLAGWLKEANIMLKANGLPVQTAPLDAQRLLKSITKHYSFLV
jgi:hypothetical protein